ncbi:hypothetical protein BGZ58_006203 [Dissophora ornata]|nr:hypothetical protein BGZ58_006203 [Dissophora ornata]
MDAPEMTEDQARDTVSRMFQEMNRTMSAIGDYSDSEEATDSDTQPQTGSAGPSNGLTSSSEAAPLQGGEKKKKKKKKKKSANKPDLEDLLNNAATLEPEDPFDMQSVAERVETAVTRFRKNRKFTPERLKILSTYLDYGGIHTGPKSFQGGAVKSSGLENDDGEPDFDAMNAGIDLVDLPEDGQEVDFTNVATTFLSQHFLNNTGWIEMVYYRDAPLVVAALLNYFLIRNVIPEHEQDLRSALAVAEQAKIELPLCKIISNGWPSRYDKACSLLFGGEWYGFLDSQWQDQQVLVETLGMNRATAEKIVKSLIGADIDLKSITVSPRQFMEFEIIRIDIPTELEAQGDTLDGAESQSEMTAEDEARIVAMVDKMLLGEAHQGEGQTIEALPSPFDNSDSDRLAAEEDLIPIPLFADVIFAEWDHELPREEQKPMDQRQKIHVYFDPSIATKMLLGMRVTAYVYTLSNGMSYLEQASIFPTYYLEADEIEVPLDEWDD